MELKRVFYEQKQIQWQNYNFWKAYFPSTDKNTSSRSGKRKPKNTRWTTGFIIKERRGSLAKYPPLPKGYLLISALDLQSNGSGASRGKTGGGWPPEPRSDAVACHGRHLEARWCSPNFRFRAPKTEPRALE